VKEELLGEKVQLWASPGCSQFAAGETYCSSLMGEGLSLHSESVRGSPHSILLAAVFGSYRNIVAGLSLGPDP